MPIIKCPLGCSCGRHRPLSAEHREAISRAQRERFVSEETRAKNRKARLGSKASEDTKKRMSISKIGNTNLGIYAVPGAMRSEQFRDSVSMRMAGNAWNKGKKLSQDVKDRMSESGRRAKLRHIAENPPGCRCAYHKFPTSTSIELILYRLLEDFPEVVKQKWFGRFRVDAYLPPPYHLAFEADGEYWHSRPGKVEHDCYRDAILLTRFNLPVVRLTESELRECSKQL